MKKLLILSGKGGTGKTTVAAAFVEFSKARAFADCDVDAPNLHLVVSDLKSPQKSDYYGFGKAFIDKELCSECGKCIEHCRFDAICSDYVVGEFECEGCSVCVEVCPEKAIVMKDHVSGEMTLYKNKERVFSTAQLKMGNGASGKLVAAVKTQLYDECADADLAIIDGSPGIGCPVIASISGVDIVLIVAEPTVSGIHDMKRIVETANKFGVQCLVCINKYDINSENTEEIERFCAEEGIPLEGIIPFDGKVVEAQNQFQSIAMYPNSPAGKAIFEIWESICKNYLE